VNLSDTRSLSSQTFFLPFFVTPPAFDFHCPFRICIPASAHCSNSHFSEGVEKRHVRKLSGAVNDDERQAQGLAAGAEVAAAFADGDGEGDGDP
jgi:hypothetical protein